MNAQTTKNTSQSLNAYQQSMVRIAALTAIGNIEQLKLELATGLDVGMTVNEIKEALVQMYAYAGFPRSLNALNTFKAVVEERESKGINDVVGRDASPIADTTNKYETGKQTLQKLTGREEKAPIGVNAFAPAIDTFLKEHLFKIGGTPVLKIDEQREFLNTIFLKMIEEQKSNYTYKDDLIRNYINLIIHEALKLQPSEHYDQHKNAASRLTSVFLELLERQFPIESADNPLRLKTAQDYANALHVHVNYLNPTWLS